jgi:hypothetical protein
MIPMSKS